MRFGGGHDWRIDRPCPMLLMEGNTGYTEPAPPPGTRSPPSISRLQFQNSTLKHSNKRLNFKVCFFPTVLFIIVLFNIHLAAQGIVNMIKTIL